MSNPSNKCAKCQEETNNSDGICNKCKEAATMDTAIEWAHGMFGPDPTGVRGFKSYYLHMSEALVDISAESTMMKEVAKFKWIWQGRVTEIVEHLPLRMPYCTQPDPMVRGSIKETSTLQFVV